MDVKVADIIYFRDLFHQHAEVKSLREAPVVPTSPSWATCYGVEVAFESIRNVEFYLAGYLRL